MEPNVVPAHILYVPVPAGVHLPGRRQDPDVHEGGRYQGLFWLGLG